MSLTCDPYWALLKSHTPWHKYWPSWSWPYGSWLYNYLCNRCISPLMLWVRIPLMARCTTLCDQVCQWLAADRCFFCLLRFYPRIKQTATIWLKEALSIIKPNKKQWHKWDKVPGPIFIVQRYKMTKTAASDFLYRDMNSMMKPEQEEEDDEEESWWRMRNANMQTTHIRERWFYWFWNQSH